MEVEHMGGLYSLVIGIGKSLFTIYLRGHANVQEILSSYPMPDHMPTQSSQILSSYIRIHLEFGVAI